MIPTDEVVEGWVSDAGTLYRAHSSEPRPTFVRRASKVLLLLAGISLLGFLLALGAGRQGASEVDLLVAALLIGAPGITSLLLSIALDRGTPWAPTAGP
jgi:hypothetical protein